MVAFILSVLEQQKQQESKKQPQIVDNPNPYKRHLTKH